MYMTPKLTDVKQLKEGESLVQCKSSGKMGRVIKVLIAENLFTVRYTADGKVQGFCEPAAFTLVIPNVPGTVPRGSQ